MLIELRSITLSFVHAHSSGILKIVKRVKTQQL